MADDGLRITDETRGAAGNAWFDFSERVLGSVMRFEHLPTPEKFGLDQPWASGIALIAVPVACRA